MLYSYFNRHGGTPDETKHKLCTVVCACVCVCVIFQFILDVRLVDVPAGVTQEEGHTGLLIHLPSVVLALIFLARWIQPFLCLVDREVNFCVLAKLQLQNPFKGFKRVPRW